MNKSARPEIMPMQINDISAALRLIDVNNLGKWTYNDFETEIGRNDSILYVAKIKDNTIGFCCARLITSTINNIKSLDGSDEIEKKNAEVEIYNIAVDTSCRKQGIGKKLLGTIVLVGKKHNADSIWLEVRKSNEAAINFYRINNFTTVYERKNFYSNPSENAVVMQKRLDAGVKKRRNFDIF